MDEVWRPLVDYPRYEVSNFGNVRSLHGAKGLRKTPRAKVLQVDKDGYHVVSICLGKHATTTRKRVHIAVAEAFIGPKPEGMQVAHRDGTKTNNKVSNLLWATPEQNTHHKWAHGTMACGERNGNSKLTEMDVRTIREMLTVYTMSYVSRIYKVSVPTIQAIRDQYTWKHING